MQNKTLTKNSTNSTERDSLEHEKQNFRKRSTKRADPDGGKDSYDDSLKTNYYKGEGNYTLEYKGQLTQRRKRSLDWTDTVEASLLAYINQSTLILTMFTIT